MQAETERVVTETAEIVNYHQFTSKTVFGKITKFEPVRDGTIRTEHFLLACKELTGILDHLGTSYSLAKKDMLGNIKRIDEHFKRNPKLFDTLNGILEEESHIQMKPNGTASGVIWLKRALEFLRAFISGLSREHHQKVTEENLRQTVLQAYETTLRPYHGVMSQFLFSNISRLVPGRKTFLRTLMLEQNATADMVISDLDLYLPNFSATLDLLEDLLNGFGLKTLERV